MPCAMPLTKKSIETRHGDVVVVVVVVDMLVGVYVTRMIHFSGSKLLWLMMILECVVAKTKTFRITKRPLVPSLMLLYCACPLHKT